MLVGQPSTDPHLFPAEHLAVFSGEERQLASADNFCPPDSKRISISMQKMNCAPKQWQFGKNSTADQICITKKQDQVLYEAAPRDAHLNGAARPSELHVLDLR